MLTASACSPARRSPTRWPAVLTTRARLGRPARGDTGRGPPPARPLPRARSQEAPARHRRGAARCSRRRSRPRRARRRAGAPLTSRAARLGWALAASRRSRSRPSRWRGPRARAAAAAPALHDLLRVRRRDRRRRRQLGDLPRRPARRLRRQRQPRGSRDSGSRSSTRSGRASSPTPRGRATRSGRPTAGGSPSSPRASCARCRSPTGASRRSATRWRRGEAAGAAPGPSSSPRRRDRRPISAVSGRRRRADAGDARSRTRRRRSPTASPPSCPTGGGSSTSPTPGRRGDEGTVYLASLDGGERRLLYRSRRAPIYAEPGYLIDAIDDRLVAQSVRPRGGRAPRRAPAARGGDPAPTSTPRTGPRRSPGRGRSWCRPRKTSGRRSSGSTAGDGWSARFRCRGRTFVSPRLSPDGRRLALSSRGPEGVGVGPLGRRPRDRAGEPADLRAGPRPLSRLVAGRPAPRLPDRPLAAPSTSGPGPRAGAAPSGCSTSRRPPGRSRAAGSADTLAFGTAEAETGFDVWLLRPDRPRSLRSTSSTRPRARTIRAISPDGRWLAFASNESGRERGLRRVAARREGQVPGDDRREDGTRSGRGAGASCSS